MKKSIEYKELTLLGGPVEKFPENPEKSILETFSNKYENNKYTVEFIQEGEFTSLCPVTGQPDFADIIIRYIPLEKLVEAKSLKLYLMAYRNTAEFGEFIVNKIMEDLWDVCKPQWIEITGNFRPRGGIGWSATVTRGVESEK